MAIENKLDTDVTSNDVDLKYSDVPLYYESDEKNQFKHKSMHSPFNPGLKNKPLNTKNDQYAASQRVGV